MACSEKIVVLPTPVPEQDSPFHLDNEQGYQAWRDQKLDNYPARVEELVVELAEPRQLTKAEHAQLLRLCRKANMVVYVSDSENTADKNIPRSLGRQFGLNRLDPNMLADDDGITSLQVVAGKSLRGYIPYTDRRILWHTDGYYNSPECRIEALLLHCVSQAAEGGENSLLDPEVLYIMIRDTHPEYIDALMQPDAMTIPANREQGIEPRPAVSGPVFSVTPQTGALHMRYTARTRSIEWKPDAVTQAAVSHLTKLLDEESPYIFNHRLEPGQGLISNNVLHTRNAFTNGEQAHQQRLIYRARYYDRVAGTDLLSDNRNT